MGDPRFHRLLKRLGELHDRKSADYGTPADPLANYRKASEQGLEPWRGVCLRLSDKWSRINTYCCTGQLENESFEDALLDNAAHSLITLILWGEEQKFDAMIAAAMKAVPIPPIPRPPAPETIVTPEDIWPCGCYRMDGETGGCSKHSGARHG